MGDRREIRKTNWRVRKAVGVRPLRKRSQSELAELLERADPADFDRIHELLKAEDDAAN